MEFNFGVGVAMTIALVEVLKRTDQEACFERFYPVISVAIGFSMAYLLGTSVVEALVIGLTASGTYDLAAKTILNK